MNNFLQVPPIVFGQSIAVLFFVCATLLAIILASSSPTRFNRLFRPGAYLPVVAGLGIICGTLTFILNILAAISPGVTDGGTPSLRTWFSFALTAGVFAALLLVTPLGRDSAHPRIRAFLILFALLPPVYLSAAVGRATCSAYERSDAANDYEPSLLLDENKFPVALRLFIEDNNPKMTSSQIRDFMSQFASNPLLIEETVANLRLIHSEDKIERGLAALQNLHWQCQNKAANDYILDLLESTASTRIKLRALEVLEGAGCSQYHFNGERRRAWVSVYCKWEKSPRESVALIARRELIALAASSGTPGDFSRLCSDPDL